MNSDFIKAINEASIDIHANAVTKGFWRMKIERERFFEILANPSKMAIDLCEDAKRHNTLAMLMLTVTELAEAAESVRCGDPVDDKIPEFSNTEIELADTVIRIMDICAARGYRLGEAIVVKHNFNQGRPYMHGKKL